VENPVRTEAHLAKIDERRRALESWCSAHLAGQSRFVLEIGCGHGHFLTAYATAHPDEMCIGIDIESERIERAARKQRRAGLENLHFVRAEARLFLEVLPVGVGASSAYILFPDPWPKRRHHKHRLLTPSFLERLAARSCDGARLYFRTDYAPYFADARRAAGAAPSWEVAAGAWPFEAPTVFQERAREYHSFVAVRRKGR
jgi:tRNA (guanine-N7-)-methyltransferase